MQKRTKIFIATAKDIIGSSLIDYFRSNGFKNVKSDIDLDIDLLNQNSVYSFFKKEKPKNVFLTNIQSGGIFANIRHQAEFVYNNLQIQNNIIHSSFKCGVKKLLFVGSSCIYPRNCPQPIKEGYLLSGKLEESNEPYAIAKIAGLKMCQSYSRQYGLKYIVLIPATIYGPADNFDSKNGHVIPSLINRFHQAKIGNKVNVIVWGTGRPRREFLYVDDVINACIFLMDHYNSSEIINVGCQEDLSIKELVALIKDIVGFKGKINFDHSKPDGVTRKLLDSSKIAKLGWKPKISMEKGIRLTYEWYKKNEKAAKRSN